MQKIISLVVGISLFGFTVVPVQAAFSNLYVFGDSISTTTNNTSGLSFYYGQRYSNGRVWVEVLAQRQGLTYDPNKNWSYFYNSSTTMLANVSSFKAPLDASNALFVIWVNCADLWFPAMYSGTSMSQWTSAINQSQTNHYKAATNLYAKGARTLIMPNAVDVSTIPEFDQSANVSFIHTECLAYNVAFSNTLNRIRASCPNLTLYTPDFFTLLTNLLAHPANYGLTNALCDGASIDAVDAVSCDSYTYPSAATNGYGTNYIFWDTAGPDCNGPYLDGQYRPATHLAGANQPAHGVQRQQSVGYGQRSDWPEWFGPWLHESVVGELDDQCQLLQHQYNAIHFCAHRRCVTECAVFFPKRRADAPWWWWRMGDKHTCRHAAALSAAFPLLLDLAVIRRLAAR